MGSVTVMMVTQINPDVVQVVVAVAVAAAAAAADADVDDDTDATGTTLLLHKFISHDFVQLTATNNRPPSQNTRFQVIKNVKH